MAPRMTRDMMGRWRERDERGQSLVEFALVLPLLLLVLFAIVDFGRAFQAHVSLTHATREGARAGAVGADSAGITSRVQAAAPNLTPVVSVIYPDTGGNRAGNSVHVQSTTAITLITPLAGLINLSFGGSFSNSFTLNASTSMRIE